MATDNWAEWQAPPQDAPEWKKLGWINEGTEEGQATLRNQRGFQDWRKSMEILGGHRDLPNDLMYRSRLSTNRLKRNAREVIGALSNIRPIWGYFSDNAAYKSYASMFNKTSRALYLEGMWDQSIKEALQYAAATCQGWVRPIYRKPQGWMGSGRIQLLTYGQPCVLPVQLPANNDWQEAYVVHLIDELPIYMAHSMFPEFQDRLQPTTSRYWYNSEIRRSAIGNMWQRLFKTFKRANDSSTSDIYIPIRYSTIIDNSMNTSGSTVPMGKVGSPWYYEVPSYGEPIPHGFEGGVATYRKANEVDARLYPYRRLMISSQDCLLYDGPAFNWHGQLDLVPFGMDSWAWEAIGFSLFRDGYELQQSIDEISRGMMDKVRAQLNPSLGYDMNAVARKDATDYDPFRPGSRIGFDGSQVDKPFVPAVPPETYEIKSEVGAFRDYLESTMDYQMSVKDVVALAKARVMAQKGGNDADTWLEAAGPIVKDMSRAMEKPLAIVGEQVKYLILQYLPPARIMQYVGADGVTQEIFDYNPTSVVPSHLPTDTPGEASRHTQAQRAKWLAGNLRFVITPHSIHEITQMQYRLMLLQLRQRQIPIDSRTIAEACDIPNFGTKPEGDTVYERFQNEQEDMAMFSMRLQKIAQVEGVELGVVPMGPAGAGAPGGGGKKAGGRPPTAQAAPQLKQKDGGTRQTVTES